MYSILETQEHELVGMIAYDDSGWGNAFTKGELVNIDEPKNIQIKLESDHDVIPDYFELDATPIISENFVRILKTTAVDNYQLFPVIISSPSKALEGYYILNVVGRVACIDIENSDTKMFKERIVRLQKLVFKEDLKIQLDMFRAHEYPLAIFISDNIKMALDAAKLSGYLIFPAVGYNDKHRF